MRAGYPSDATLGRCGAMRSAAQCSAMLIWARKRVRRVVGNAKANAANVAVAERLAQSDARAALAAQAAPRPAMLKQSEGLRLATPRRDAPRRRKWK